MENTVKINIPKADEKEVANIPKGSIGDIKKKFKKIDQILFGIMIAVVLSLAAIIISMIGLFIDQMRYNSTAYRDYSEKLETSISTKEMYDTILQQNKENQELIIKQQNQILILLNKEPTEKQK